MKFNNLQITYQPTNGYIFGADGLYLSTVAVDVLRGGEESDGYFGGQG